MINVLFTKEELEAVIGWGEYVADVMGEAGVWEERDEEAMEKVMGAYSALGRGREDREDPAGPGVGRQLTFWDEEEEDGGDE